MVISDLILNLDLYSLISFLAQSVTLMPSLQTATERFWVKSQPGRFYRQLWVNVLGG